jgi:hypothetical protein
MSRFIFAVVFAVAALLSGCGQEGEFPTEPIVENYEEATLIDETESALRVPADKLCSGEDCTSHQGCFYVNRYARRPFDDPRNWEYHALNCVVYHGNCTCPAITPWSLLLNTCKNMCIDDDEIEEEPVRESRGRRHFSPR